MSEGKKHLHFRCLVKARFENFTLGLLIRFIVVPLVS